MRMWRISTKLVNLFFRQIPVAFLFLTAFKDSPGGNHFSVVP